MTKPTPESDDELPGMWEHADFTGGDPDERCYAERERTTPEITEAMIERGARAWLHDAHDVQFDRWHPLEQAYLLSHARACILAALEEPHDH